MIARRNQADIEGVRDACRVAANVLEAIVAQVRPGISTLELDLLGRDLIMEAGAISACYGYRAGPNPYPAYTCISVNEEVVHGIGSARRVLEHGDIVALDVVVNHRGYIGDNACTVGVGMLSEQLQSLIETTEEAFFQALPFVVAGNRVGDISHAVQTYVEARGFSVVRDFVGHGVGRSMHEEPQIPNFGRKNTGPRLLPGMTLAIEPMVNFGKPQVRVLSDGWTVVTVDGQPSAHYEHTVLVGNDAPEILTLRPSDRSARLQPTLFS